MPSLRPFTATDINACLDVFDSNLPTFFAAHERTDFSRYLLQPERQHDYLVLERHDKVVACGGIALEDPATAAFCWGMVEQALHRQGLGKVLALARIAQARALGAQRLVLSTSQHTQAFYAALGFRVTRVVADGHGPGLDAVEMVLEMGTP